MPTTARKRASTPRSKNGCLTCKTRRLKCGEERPSCLRCIKSGWHCDGYVHVAKSPSCATMVLAPIRPRSQSASPSPTPPQSPPSEVLQLDDRELGYFQHFFTDVSFQYQDHARFWDYALKESNSSFSILHGIVALGALSQSAKQLNSAHYRVDLTQGTHREFALEQYQKALQNLREAIPGIHKGESVQKTLMSCFILSCFDNFLGNGGFSLQHITYARNVLSTSEQLKTTPPTAKLVEDGENILMTVFYQMDLQALCFLGADENRTYVQFELRNPIVSMPAKLCNIDEARNARNVLVWNGYRRFYQTDFYQLGPKEAIPPSAMEVRDCLVRQLYTLHEQIDLVLLDCKCNPQLHPFARPDAMKAPQTTSDALLAEFEYLLSMARKALEFEAEGYPMIQSGEVYCVEVLTLNILHLIATKCREPSIRRQSITLLLAVHRREGIYDSILAGRIGQWMMKLEEEGLDDNGNIPEHARVWGDCVELDLQRRRAKVKCRQNVRHGGWIWRETEISW